MLLLVFYLGDDKYMIKYNKIREIAPMVRLKPMPYSPDYFAGFFNYRGMVMPVIDLCQLIRGYPCKLRMSTRIIIVDYYMQEDNTPKVFGFIAERVTETIIKSENALMSPGINMPDMPYLGGFIMEQEKMIQCIDFDLLSKKFHFQHLLEHDTGNVSGKN